MLSAFQLGGDHGRVAGPISFTIGVYREHPIKPAFDESVSCLIQKMHHSRNAGLTATSSSSKSANSSAFLGFHRSIIA